MTLLKGAMIGFGTAAASFHLPGWKMRNDFEICAVVDPVQDRLEMARREIPGIKTYYTVDELFEREDLDFIDICTPPALHGEIVRKACQKGVHILCEKPLMISLEEYKEARNLIMKDGRVLFTIHSWKYAPLILKIQEILKERAIGEVFYAELNTFRSEPSRIVGDGENWRFSPSIAGGGIMMDHGWHSLYLLCSIIGQRPHAISARMRRLKYLNVSVEDTVSCFLDFPSAIGEIHLTWAAGNRSNEGVIVGKEGLIRIESDRIVVQRGNEEPQLFSFSESLSAKSSFPQWFVRLLSDFREEILDPRVRGTNLKEAELCLLLAHLAYQSNAEGSRLIEVPQGIM
ncbi:MAG: Gfo/Idh/MocA family oxidoreductase [Candidatus Tectomicrobia bacterium]|nr:Gfo/Idh/MocA family oxidoreductase [Candidatus Tectomicrobia bacterium]